MGRNLASWGVKRRLPIMNASHARFRAISRDSSVPGDGEPPAATPAGDMSLIGPDRLTMTSEPKIDVSYRLEADEDPVLEHGVAVVWIDRDPFT